MLRSYSPSGEALAAILSMAIYLRMGYPRRAPDPLSPSHAGLRDTR